MWAFLDKISKKDLDCDSKYYFHADSGQTNHLTKLDILANLICEESKDDDVIIFMDGDAWPIKPIGNFIAKSLDKVPLGAVIRTENGERYPHPCFLFTTVGFWKEAGLSWSKYNVNYILHVLEARKSNWIKMRRTSGLTDHPVFFSIYDEKVYHHGAGFRMPVSAYCNKNKISVTKEESLSMIEIFKEKFGDV